MAKRFYTCPYLFLSRTYKNVEVVYIRHHPAKEVDEHEFSLLAGDRRHHRIERPS